VPGPTATQDARPRTRHRHHKCSLPPVRARRRWSGRASWRIFRHGLTSVVVAAVELDRRLDHGTSTRGRKPETVLSEKTPPSVAFPVRPRRLELPRTNRSTRPSTLYGPCRCFCQRLDRPDCVVLLDGLDVMDGVDVVTGVVTGGDRPRFGSDKSAGRRATVRACRPRLKLRSSSSS